MIQIVKVFLKPCIGSLLSNPRVIKSDLLMSLPLCVSLFANEKFSEFSMIINCLVDLMFLMRRN